MVNHKYGFGFTWRDTPHLETSENDFYFVNFKVILEILNKLPKWHGVMIAVNIPDLRFLVAWTSRTGSTSVSRHIASRSPTPTVHIDDERRDTHTHTHTHTHTMSVNLWTDCSSVYACTWMLVPSCWMWSPLDLSPGHPPLIKSSCREINQSMMTA